MDEDRNLRGWYAFASDCVPCACTLCTLSRALRDLLSCSHAPKALDAVTRAQLLAEDGSGHAIAPCAEQAAAHGHAWGALYCRLARAMLGAAEQGRMWPVLAEVVGMPPGDSAPGDAPAPESCATFASAVHAAVAAQTAADAPAARGALCRGLRAVAESLGDDEIGAVRRLLGMRATAGSTRSLPPVRGALLAAAAQLHPKSALTVSARALAKHAQRCSAGFWGGAAYKGKDIDKNLAAEEVLGRLLDGAAWLNCHQLPHNKETFELRNASGYGARWVGGIFRGFLEPHIANGHEMGWKH